MATWTAHPHTQQQHQRYQPQYSQAHRQAPSSSSLTSIAVHQPSCDEERVGASTSPPMMTSPKLRTTTKPLNQSSSGNLLPPSFARHTSLEIPTSAAAAEAASASSSSSSSSISSLAGLSTGSLSPSSSVSSSHSATGAAAVAPTSSWQFAEQQSGANEDDPDDDDAADEDQREHDDDDEEDEHRSHRSITFWRLLRTTSFLPSPSSPSSSASSSKHDRRGGGSAILLPLALVLLAASALAFLLLLSIGKQNLFLGGLLNSTHFQPGLHVVGVDGAAGTQAIVYPVDVVPRLLRYLVSTVFEEDLHAYQHMKGIDVLLNRFTQDTHRRQYHLSPDLAQHAGAFSSNSFKNQGAWSVFKTSPSFRP